LPPDLIVNLGRLRGSITHHSFDDSLKGLSTGSVIRIPARDNNDSEKHAEVTCVSDSTVAELVNTMNVHRAQLEFYAGRPKTQTRR
jgi:hypothetical protein